ncbi:hypothetical protein GCM10022422_36880 [Flavobacterium ginsengisoli]|uniref:SMODS and SLOG-associating 2TM effector domain-containing protein n=1 Tax=Flavobacterium ginsengisoli TaxID=871694 RepID=A0ABP7FVW4_9FLAO|nr:S-4TM family putative pore-forming effector [Flavobacterium ginsengisoli]
MNTIKTEQNASGKLKYLKAGRILYSRAKSAFGIQIIVTVGLTIIFSFLKLIPKDQLVFDLNACIGVAALVITCTEILYFNLYVSGLRTSGAKAQELFDCNVYSLTWNSINSGSKPEKYIIEHNSAQYIPDSKAPIENWYDIDLENLSRERAVLLCQETNLFYDTQLREHFKMANILVCVGLVVMSLFIAILSDIQVNSYITAVLLPVLPMIVLTLKIVMENRKSLAFSTELRKTVLQLKERPQDPTETELRSVQDKIFCSRKDSPLVPDWYYKWRRNSLEKLMKTNANTAD